MKLPTGLHLARLSPKCGNPREVAFVQQWRREHEYRDLLAQLFVVPCTKDASGALPSSWFSPGGYIQLPLGEKPTERDRIVVATVIQWLGSNCGLSFLREALEQVGYRIQYPQDRLGTDAETRGAGNETP